MSKKELKRLNPLHKAKFLDQHVRNTGTYFPEARRTGRTTALALGYISQAIRKPHQWIDVRDHEDTRCQHESLTRLCTEMIWKLGLEHFIAQGSRCRIAFGQPDMHAPHAPFTGDCVRGRRDVPNAHLYPDGIFDMTIMFK